MNARRIVAATATGMVILLGSAGLTGCAVPVPQSTPEPESTTVYPVLDEGRLDRVLASVQTSLADADAALDPDLLPPRITERAEAVRAAEYRLAKATKDDEEPYTPQPLGTDDVAAVVAATEDWPRTVMVATTPPAGSNAPRLLVLTQQEPRDDYSMVGWVRLLPGVSTPTVAASEIGVDPVAPDDPGLLIAPDEVAAAYAETVEKGDKADSADLFADDIYRTALRDEVKAQQKSLEVAGTVKNKVTAQDGVAALATADGGAIVYAGLTSTMTYERTVARSTMKVGSQYAALNDGEDEVDESITGSYLHMIAFYIPPADAGEDAQVSVLGAERVLTKVTAK
ncbi:MULTISPECIES: hypothetical protein [unclassified Pseudactinotalea]|uniref:hypothetical protein n=1 Tax=unclassified Pseudactinotalea TaxID=2649176 RepID=UPI00128C6D87|nr:MULTISPECIES: hypothetical protein [unclassified Pseudactinotalea]MPV50308.1 hypothetical protein [Pseudactinotalea sp. HY160]QGH68908.1 hypothetical protein GCE65_04870 [Pseudactinotalea sp. HY158]